MINDIINVDAIYDLRRDIHFDDHFVHTSNVLSEGVTDWDEFQKCMLKNSHYDCSIISKSKTKYDLVSTTEIKTKSNLIEQRHPSHDLETFHDRGISSDPRDYFEDGFGVVIKNYEEEHDVAKSILNFLLDTFYINLDDHGVWPAFINQYSGHVHLYGALKGSNFLGLHADPYTNFIFVVDGELEVDVYRNRTCTLMDHGFDLLSEETYRKDIIDTFDLSETITAVKGDMLYIPNRQMHEIKPKENSLYLSMPLILKGPMAL